MTGFLVSAATGPMNSLLCKLVTLLGDEYKLLKGVRKEIRALRDELSSMNSLLRRLSVAGDDELDVQRKEWRNKVRELAYDVEDCIDVFMHQLRRPGGGGSNTNKTGLVRKLTAKIKKLRRARRIAVQIQELKSRVVEESGRRDRYKLDDVPVRGKNRRVEIDPRLPAMYSEAKSLVGIDGPRDKIVHRLTDQEQGDQLAVVSIVGFGGVGKTTLANQVYCKIKGSFECAAFVSVSQSPDLSRVLSDMLSQLGCSRMRNLNDPQKLVEKIRERLSHRRYLVVVDDIWSIQAWDIIKCVFVQDNYGSRVITTTRIEQVATTCCSYCHNNVYKMKPLNDLDSRRLFFQRIFGSEDACPKQYQSISEKILKKCGGVPLVIISIASLLASQECLKREKWEKIQKSLVFELETSPDLGWVRHVLNLSYNDLSHSLKTCFLYLGIYPEDHKIEKVNLLRCWIAEGFVSHEHDLSPEEVAESYFNELVNRSIIQPTEFEYGELTYCKVHDILLNFIMLKSNEENFITRMDGQHIIKGDYEVRRLCLQLKNIRCLFPTNMKLSQIRSITIFGYPDCLTCLPRFQLLRVLDLYYCDKFDGNELLDLSTICKLFQLRYLRTNSQRLQLPKQIRDLENLQTLDIRDAIIQGIPSDVSHLKSLRHLNIPIDVKLPNGIGKMVTLCALGFFNVAENSIDNIRDLGELTNLMDLDLIWIKQVVKAQGPSEKLKISSLIDSLGKLTNLRSLYVSSIDDTKLISPTCDFLSCWSPPPRNLQRFCMSFCTISKVPEWISQLDKLTSLKIKVKELRGDDIQLLGELPCLIYLDLSAPKDPKCDIFFYDNAYPSLVEFGFAYTFASVAFAPRTMTKLQVLYLSFYKLRQQQEDVSLSGIEHLLNLEKLTARIYNHGKIGVSFMNAILKHPRSQTFNILFPRC